MPTTTAAEILDELDRTALQLNPTTYPSIRANTRKTLWAVIARAIANHIPSGTGFVVETRTSDPTSPTEGQIWLRTDL